MLIELLGMFVELVVLVCLFSRKGKDSTLAKWKTIAIMTCSAADVRAPP